MLRFVICYATVRVDWRRRPGRPRHTWLRSDPKRRPPSAQPRTQLSMATCPGQRTMEARQLVETATLQPGARS